MRIRTRLTIVLLLVALVPLAGVSITGYIIGRHIVTRQVLNQLESVASIQKSRVEGRAAWPRAAASRAST